MVDDVNTYADGCWDADEQPERSDVLFWLSSCLNECRQRGVELYVTYTQAVSDQVWAATLHRIAELVEKRSPHGHRPLRPTGGRTGHNHEDQAWRPGGPVPRPRRPQTVSPANQSVLAYTFNEVFEIEQSGARLPVLVFEDGSRSRPHGVYARHS